MDELEAKFAERDKKLKADIQEVKRMIGEVQKDIEKYIESINTSN